MPDPRNVAHDKKVIHEKEQHGDNPAKGAAVDHVQPGKKPGMKHHEEHTDPATERQEAGEAEAEEVRHTVETHAERTEPHKTNSSSSS